MACQRCSTCGINYPTVVSDCKVEGCGERLSPLQNASPDTDWPARVKQLSGQLQKAAEWTAGEEAVHAHRVERFMALGFLDWGAELLATSRDATGFALAPAAVEQALDHGASHEQCLNIFV